MKKPKLRILKGGFIKVYDGHVGYFYCKALGKVKSQKTEYPEEDENEYEWVVYVTNGREKFYVYWQDRMWNND